MNTLSTVLGKPVISLYNGQVEGTILNAIFDKKLKKIKYLSIFNDNNEEEITTELRILETKNIYNLGQDAVVIKNNSCLENASNYEPELNIVNPINSIVYTALGTYLGKITDIVFDDNFNVTECALNNNQSFQIDNLIKFSDGITIIQDKNKKIDVTKFKTKKPAITKTNEVVKILRIDNINNIVPLHNEDNTSPTLPTKVTSSVDFLLGRVITENLYTQSKELIAKKGNIISLKTIENARKFGKIKDLAIFSA